MPRIPESDAYQLFSRFDELSEDQKPQALDILSRYKRQQEDYGEPEWPSIEQQQREARDSLRRNFTGGLDAVPAEVSPFSDNPRRDKAIHASLPLLAQTYGKTGQEIADRYEFYRNDYASRNFGIHGGLTDEAFYEKAAGKIQEEIADEKTRLEGSKAALRGEDSAKALQSYQLANMGDWRKMLRGSRLFGAGYASGQELVGEKLPLASELMGILNSQSGMTKGDGAERPAPAGQDTSARLTEIVTGMATMTKGERKRVYASLAASIEAAGYDQKGFWAQMLGNMGRNIGNMGERVNTKGVEVGIVASAAPIAAGAEFDFLAPTMSDENRRDMEAAIDLNDKVSVVRDELAQIVAGKLDPITPTVGWLNDNVEKGLIQAPGAVAPYALATMAAGPYGAGIIAAADFAEQNRLELINAGLDPQDAKRIGMMAAPGQAAIESLSNMVQLGRFPAVQKALSSFTKPIAGKAGMMARYLQNSAVSGLTEFTEEQLQDNVILPASQNLAAAIDADVPNVGMGEIFDRIKASSPDLIYTLAPMALVFGGVMTSAQANLSESLTADIDGLKSLGFSQAQATQISQAEGQDGKITKAREMWGRRAGTQVTMNEAAQRLSEKLRTFQTDAVAAQQELERRGILPRVLHTDQDSWRLTFNDGSTADYATHGEASTARWQWTEDQLGRFHALTRDTLNSLESGIEKNREIAVQFSPDARTAAQAVGDNQAQRDQIERRLEQGKALGDINPDDAYTNAIAVDKAQAASGEDPLASIQILGSSRNEFKDGILRTTIKLWEGSSVLTLVEEKLEGDAKAIMMQKGGRDWMLTRLRNYEAESGDKLFRDAADDQLTADDLVEAWSHLGQSYLVGRSTYGEPLQSKAQRRFGKLLMKSGLAGALNAENAFFASVASRAQKLNELRAAGKLPADVAEALEGQLGLSFSQTRHEAGAVQESQSIAADADPQETFSIGKGDFESRMSAAFSPFQKSPELRVAVAQVAKQRALKLGAEWIEKAGVIRRTEDIKREAKTREALKADELMGQGVAEKAARAAAKTQAKEWEAQALKEAKSPANQRAMLQAALRTLDGILAAAPPEVRAKVGGYVKIAGLATDEAMLKEVERRVEKLNVELEKWLKKEGVSQIEKLLKKGRPSADSGKKAKGKDADMHHLFAAAAKAAEMSEEAVAGELARLDTLLAGDTLTPEQEVLLTTERELVNLVGDLKNAEAARVYSALDTLQQIYQGAWIKWKLKEIERKERRAGLRFNLITDTGKAGVKTERDASDREATTLLGKIKGGALSLSSFHEVLSYAFGSKSERVRALVDAEREASGQYEDVNQALADEIEQFFSEMAGGTLKGEKLRYNLSQRTIKTAKGDLSQLEALQALLMWRQEAGRQHMEGRRNENGEVTSSWSYDQAWIDEVDAALSTEARSVLGWLTAKYGAEYATLNPLYKERFGVNLPGHDNYAPITVAPQQTKAGEVVDPVSGAAISSGSILTPGSLRTRARNVVAEPQFRDALQVFVAHTRQLEYWKAYYDLATEASAILGNREVLNAVYAKGGPEAAAALRKWVDAIAQGGFRDAAATLAVNNAIRQMSNNAATVALLGRVSTLLIQSTQLAAASVKMPVGAYIVRLGKLLSGNLDWGDAIRSSFIQRRYKAAPPIIRQAMEGLADAKKPNVIKSWASSLGKLLSGADALFTGGTYAILLDYHRSTGKALGYEGAALEEWAHNEAERATEQVAQPTRMTARSLMEITNTSPLAKTVWAFSSESRQKIALMAWALANIKQDKAQAVKTAFLVFGVGGLMTQVIKNLWKEAKGDDDESKWSPERLLMGMFTSPLQGVPGMSEAMGDPGLFGGLTWARYSLKDLVNGEADMRDIETLLSAAGYFNDTAAGVASLSHLGFDFARVLENLVNDD